MLQGMNAIKRDLDRRAYENLMKFNKAKCKVLHMGQDNPKHKYRLGGDWIESSPEEKDMRGLVVEKLNMTQQWALAVQKATVSWTASPAAWPAGWGRGFSPSALVRPHWESCIQLWSPQHRRDLDLLGQGQRRPQKWSKGWNSSPVKPGWESWGCSAWRREGSGEILEQPASTWRGLQESWRGTFCKDM